MRLQPIGLLLATALSGAALGLGGCANSASVPAEPHLLAEPSALQVVKTTDTHVVQLDANGQANPLELRRLDGFIADLAGERPDALRLTIRGPQSEARLRELARHIASHGIAADKIAIAAPQTPASGGPAMRVVTVAVERAVATPPDCPGWSTGPAAPIDNTTSAKLGCANLNNLAVMVADPNDLVAGSTRQTSDGVNAAAAVKRYHDDKVKPLLSHNQDFTPSAGGPAGGGGQ
jgi:pilus biogenesis lipoprotein CpaD